MGKAKNGRAFLVPLTKTSKKTWVVSQQIVLLKGVQGTATV